MSSSPMSRAGEKPSAWRLCNFSLFGQTALLIAGAILIAQLIGFLPLARERNSLQFIDTPQVAMTRFAEVAQRIERAPFADRSALAFQLGGFATHFFLTPYDELAQRRVRQHRSIERALAAALRHADLRILNVHASSIGSADLSSSGLVSPAASGREISLSARLEEGNWLTGDFLLHPAPSYVLSRLGAAELILYVIVLGASLLIAARFTRPLRELAVASSKFGLSQAIHPLRVRGPWEVRSAIVSFNTMAHRVTELLGEKDRMIAAIGHDLRTPLASMRVRAEALDPPTERKRLIETLDDATRIVDDILCLARPVLASEAFAVVDLTALAESIVDEFQELGRCATFRDAERIPLRMQSTAVKRMLRNLIENAIKFGGQARVSIDNSLANVNLLVEDSGPGIPGHLLVEVTEPFVRLEQSRNRETGGIGLGLSIAASIARTQGAELELSNLAQGGLRACVRWAI